MAQVTNTGVSRFLNRAPRAQDTKEEQLITDGYASPWVSDTAGRRRPDVLFLIMRIVRLEFCFFCIYTQVSKVIACFVLNIDANRHRLVP